MRRCHSPRVFGPAALFILLAGSAALFSSCGRSSPDPMDDPDPVVTIQRDGFLYTYHVPSDTEGLFEIAVDPRLLDNLAAERTIETARLRLLLEQELGVKSLKDLRAAFDQTIRQLESHGYL